MENELAFLRFFYKEARHGFGPADSEIYESIKQQWFEEGNSLPEGYALEADEA